MAPRTTIVDLCKKVRSAWPKDDLRYEVRELYAQVSLLRVYPRIARYISSPKQNSKKKREATSLSNKEVKGEAAHVHRCSLDAKHHHLMIHGEALARRHMAEKQIFACNSREQEVANFHLKRFEAMRICLKQRTIRQVSLEEKPLDYSSPSQEVERHFHLTRIHNYHSR